MDAMSLIEKIKSLDIEALAVATLEDNTDAVADANAAQLARGLRTDGSQITPNYSPLTISLKQGEPGLAGVTSYVTLYSSGRHYRELFMRLQGVTITYGSNVPYSQKLEEKYATRGSQIYGLSDESRAEVIRERIAPQFYERLNKALQ